MGFRVSDQITLLINQAEKGTRKGKENWKKVKGLLWKRVRTGLGTLERHKLHPRAYLL